MKLLEAIAKELEHALNVSGKVCDVRVVSDKIELKYLDVAQKDKKKLITSKYAERMIGAVYRLSGLKYIPLEAIAQELNHVLNLTYGKCSVKEVSGKIEVKYFDNIKQKYKRELLTFREAEKLINHWYKRTGQRKK